MRAVLITPLSDNVADALYDRIDTKDPEFAQKRITIDWWRGSLRIRHPNFIAVMTKMQRTLALENAREEASKMLPEYRLDEDYEVKLL